MTTSLCGSARLAFPRLYSLVIEQVMIKGPGMQSRGPNGGYAEANPQRGQFSDSVPAYRQRKLADLPTDVRAVIA